MNIEEKEKSFKTLAEHLLIVGKRLNNHLMASYKKSMNPWGMVDD